MKMTIAELSKKYGVHPTQIGTWKGEAIKNMVSTFSRRDTSTTTGNEGKIDKLHSNIAQLVVERDFLRKAPLFKRRIVEQGSQTDVH